MKTTLLLQFNLFAFVCFLQSGRSLAQKPFIADQPDDVIAIAGNDVLLPCAIENLPLGSMVQWTKGSFGLGYDRVLSGFPRYSITGDESVGEYNLLIKNSTIEDEDEYECQVTSYGIRTDSVKLTIQVIPNDPWVAGVENKEKNVRENSENRITCHAINGRPAASVKWFKDRVQITSNVTYATVGNANDLQNSTATLTLWPSKSDDHMTYMCSLSIEVIKHGKKTVVMKNTTITVRVQKPPRANVILEPSSSAIKGSRLSALCDSVVSDPPASHYMWYLNGEEMEGQMTSRIYFNDVSENMNGYRIGCQAFNSVGKSPISTMTLNVLYPPILVTRPKDRTVEIGEEVSFGCEWEGNPAPEISWTINDEIVGKGNILYMKSVDQDDAGEVACIARSQHIGRNTAKAKLIVNGPPIAVVSESISATTGDEVKMVQCGISSTPGIASVTWNWIKNGKVFFTAGNQFIDKNGDIVKRKQGVVKYKSHFVPGEFLAQLFIYNIQEDDMTTYNCSIANDYGYVDSGIEIKGTAADFDIKMIIIYAAVAVIFIIIVVLVCYCKCSSGRSKKDEKSHDLLSNPSSMSPPTASQSLLHHVKNDPDSDNQSTQPSSSATPDELLLLMRPYRSPVPNDDGYYTEVEANHHLPRGNSSLSASSGNNSLIREQITPMLTQIDCRSITPSQQKLLTMPAPPQCMLPPSHHNRHFLPSSCRLPSPRTVESDVSSSVSSQTTSSNSPYTRTNVYSTAPNYQMKQLSAPIVCGSEMELNRELLPAINHNEEHPTRMATNV